MSKFSETTSNVILEDALESAEEIIADYATIRKTFVEDLEKTGYVSNFQIDQLAQYMTAEKTAKVLKRMINRRKETHSSPEAVESIRKYYEDALLLGMRMLDANTNTNANVGVQVNRENMTFARVARYFRGYDETLSFF